MLAGPQLLDAPHLRSGGADVEANEEAPLAGQLSQPVVKVQHLQGLAEAGGVLLGAQQRQGRGGERYSGAACQLLAACGGAGWGG